jgi:NurA-like 5'-3' nuclease
MEEGRNREEAVRVGWISQFWPIFVAIGLIILTWGTLQTTVSQNSRDIERISLLANQYGAALIVTTAKLQEIERDIARVLTELNSRTAKRDQEYQAMQHRFEEFAAQLKTDEIEINRVVLVQTRVVDRLDRLERLEADAHNRTGTQRERP